MTKKLRLTLAIAFVAVVTCLTAAGAIYGDGGPNPCYPVGCGN